MNTDFRIAVGFFSHHKTKLLTARLGLEGPWSLLQLWCFAAQNHPDGSLHGMDETAIAVAAGWTGDPERFVDGLIEVRFLERTKRRGSLRLHDWSAHQPYVVKAPMRKAKAKKAAAIRWGINENGASGGHAQGNATSNARSNAQGHARSNAPSPDPVPDPDPEIGSSQESEGFTSGEAPTENTLMPNASENDASGDFALTPPAPNGNQERRQQKREHNALLERRFKKFYDEWYPRKIQRAQAWIEFQKLDPDRATMVAINRDIVTRLRNGTWNRSDPKHIPYPERYIRKHSWR